MFKIKLLGYAFLFGGFWFALKAMKKNKTINSKSIKKIKARLVQNDCNMMPQGLLTYTPIYEYVINDEIKHYHSAYATLKPIDLGIEQTLYYNESNGEVFENSASIIDIALSILSTLVGIIIIVVTDSF